LDHKSSIRKVKRIKQKQFLARLQTLGLNISPTSLLRLEGQHRLDQDYKINHCQRFRNFYWWI